MSLHTPANNVFLSKEELDIAIQAIRTVIHEDIVVDDNELLPGILFELTIAKEHSK